MHRLPFVLWMTLAPIADSVCGYLDWLQTGKVYPEIVVFIAGCIKIVIYFIIAAALWREKG